MGEQRNRQSQLGPPLPGLKLRSGFYAAAWHDGFMQSGVRPPVRREAMRQLVDRAYVVHGSCGVLYQTDRHPGSRQAITGRTRTPMT